MADLDSSKVRVHLSPDYITFISLAKGMQLVVEWIEEDVPAYTQERDNMLEIAKSLVALADDAGIDI